MKANFKVSRMFADMTQEAAAKAIGIDVKTLRSIERGEKAIDAETLEKMASVYKTEPKNFIVEKETKVFYKSKEASK